MITLQACFYLGVKKQKKKKGTDTVSLYHDISIRPNTGSTQEVVDSICYLHYNITAAAWSRGSNTDTSMFIFYYSFQPAASSTP